MRVVFMGTPEFAVPSLEVTARDHELLAVVTQPDRQRTGAKALSFLRLRRRPLRSTVLVLQPERVGTKAFLAEMEQLKPDVIVVVAFGQNSQSSA